MAGTHGPGFLRKRLLASELAALVWLVGVMAVALAGRSTDQYLLHVRGVEATQGYPVAGVILSIGFLSVHAIILLAILRPATYAKSWLRALFALMASLGLSVWTLFSSMHTPPHFFAFVVWQLLCTAGLLLLLFISSIGAARAPRGPN